MRREPDSDAVTSAVRRLLELGARLLVVSLRNASANPANERTVQPDHRHELSASLSRSRSRPAVHSDQRRVRRRPPHVLRGCQRLHASEARHLVVPRRGRSPPLGLSPSPAGRQHRRRRDPRRQDQSAQHLSVGTDGGDHASALLCHELGVQNALTADVGGTSTDVGLLADGRPVLREVIDVGGLEVLQPSVELLSFGIGGGSIARVENGHLEVGPDSAGAVPGPACFGLGGRLPTPTDAWLVLGYLTPDYYLGGRKRLDVELARRALATLAEPLGISIEEAALALREVAEQTAATGIDELLGRSSVREVVGDLDRSAASADRLRWWRRPVCCRVWRAGSASARPWSPATPRYSRPSASAPSTSATGMRHVPQSSTTAP